MQKSGIKKYETVLVLHPELNKEMLTREVETIKEFLVANGAQDLQQYHWGKRELAYPAKKHKHGSYVALEYRVAPENTTIVSILSSALRIRERILKFQTHRINEHPRKFKGNPKRVGSPAGEEDMVFGFDDTV